MTNVKKIGSDSLFFNSIWSDLETKEWVGEFIEVIDGQPRIDPVMIEEKVITDNGVIQYLPVISLEEDRSKWFVRFRNGKRFPWILFFLDEKIPDVYDSHREIIIICRAWANRPHACNLILRIHALLSSDQLYANGRIRSQMDEKEKKELILMETKSESEIAKKSHKSIYRQFQEFWQKIQWEETEKGKLPEDIGVLWNFFIHDYRDNKLCPDSTKPKLPKNIRKKFEEFSRVFAPNPEENGYQICVGFLNAFKAQLPDILHSWTEAFIEVYMSDPPRENIHRLIHTFDHAFKDEDRFVYRFKGHELMQKIEEFVEHYPKEGMKIIHCDDSFHSCSMILLIPHKSSSQYWGTTVVYVPQTTGESPIEFFLYPYEVKNMISSLQAIQKLEKTCNWAP